jgi:FkbM family methyltransferase
MRVSDVSKTAAASLRSSPLARRIRRSAIVELGYQTLGRGRILRLPQVQIELEISPRDTLVDCGSNVGQITSQFARTGATVHAFEPNKSCYKILRKRFRFTPNVTIHHAGVMHRSCVLTLRVLRQTPDLSWETSVAGSFLHEPTETSNSLDKFDSYDVECIDLAEWVLSRPNRIRLLKLDIEGAEIAVINRLIDSGAIERIDQLFCETHDNVTPSLIAPTEALRARIEREGLGSRVRLDWP